jgi:hypothetical protein
MSDVKELAFRAFVGVSFPIMGAVTSWQEHFEWGLRVASLLVGLAVGIISLVAIIRKKP